MDFEVFSAALKVNLTSPVLSVIVLLPCGFRISSYILISYTQFFKVLL